MISPALLILDQGGHSSRALLFSGEGEVLARARRPVATQHPRPHWVEQDPLQVLDSLREAAAEATAGITTGQSLSAALATQRSSIVCWHRHSGEPLSPVLSWQDRRAAAMLPALDHRFIHQATGLFPNPHYGATKLRWCLENLPRVQQAAADGTLAMGPLASYLVFRLTHEHTFAVDPANGSRTLLWNLHNGAWDPQLLRMFSVGATMLPAPAPSLSPFGSLDVPGCSAIPLRLVTGDQSAALFGFGALQAGTAYINMGTGAFIQYPLAQLPPLPERLLLSIALQDGDRRIYALEGTVNGAASAVSWLAEQEGCDPSQWDAERMLADAGEPPLFLNGIGGAGSPYWSSLESQFVTREPEPGLAQRYAAVVESVVFGICRNLQEMSRSGAAVKRVLVSGGMSRIDGLCQRLAHVSALPVVRPRETEATARGAAFLLAGQPAHWQALDSHVFEPGAAPALNQRYERWKAAMRAAVRAGRNDQSR